ncbi:MAG TPA: response regulator transcription factor [Pseudonocardiaceae bacterium]|jgi:DNA-binding NarL/FixJ family response regulator|nr:response regulator transcription factor [Pseudonocardiaceae bacterium]
MMRAPAAPNSLPVLAVQATPLIRDGLRIAIGKTTGLTWTGCTADVHAVRASLPRLRPRVVLLDSALDPDGSLIRELTKADSTLTVVVLLDDRQSVAGYARIAKMAGARGVVAATATPANLVAAILSAHRSPWFVDPDLVRVPKFERPFVSSTPGTVALSERQRQILGMIMDGMGSAAIAERLVVSPETVRSHVRLLLRRLGARDRAHAVARAYQLGVVTPVLSHRGETAGPTRSGTAAGDGRKPPAV